MFVVVVVVAVVVVLVVVVLLYCVDAQTPLGPVLRAARITGILLVLTRTNISYWYSITLNAAVAQ